MSANTTKFICIYRGNIFCTFNRSFSVELHFCIRHNKEIKAIYIFYILYRNVFSLMMTC